MTSGAKTVGDKSDGCATKDVLLMQVSFTPQWLQAFPGVDLSAPMSLGYGLHGNGATLGGGTAINWQTSLQTPTPVRDEWADVSGCRHFAEESFTRSLDAVMALELDEQLALMQTDEARVAMRGFLKKS